MAEHLPEHDRTLAGCGLGCLCQLAAILLGLFGGYFLKSNIPWAIWGLTQWIGLVPLILNERAKGCKRVMTGLIVTGCIGLLLCSACANMTLFGGKFFS